MVSDFGIMFSSLLAEDVPCLQTLQYFITRRDSTEEEASTFKRLFNENHCTGKKTYN